MIIEGGDSRGYNSKIPIEAINTFIKKLHHHSGCGAAYGERSATLSYCFKKTKTIKNPEYSIWKIFNPFNSEDCEKYIEVEHKVDYKGILEKVEEFLIHDYPYLDITSTLKGNQFNFKILTAKEKEIEKLKNKVNDF